MSEQWLPVPGFEMYEVSDVGHVRSLDRWVNRSDGRKYFRRGRIMKTHPLPHSGHVVVKFKVDGAVKTFGVHTLVAEAFIGPRPDGMDVCHNNGLPGDNQLANLRYGSRSENISDAVKHGTHNMARKTHCKFGHAFDEANTIHRSVGGRECATCRREQRHASRARRRALATVSA